MLLRIIILYILVGFLYFARILASKLTATIMTNEPIQKFRLGTLSQKNQSQMLEKITPVKAKGVMTLAGAYLKARVSNNWKISPNPPTKINKVNPCNVGIFHCAMKKSGNKIEPNK